MYQLVSFNYAPVKKNEAIMPSAYDETEMLLTSHG